MDGLVPCDDEVKFVNIIESNGKKHNIKASCFVGSYFSLRIASTIAMLYVRKYFLVVNAIHSVADITVSIMRNDKVTETG